MPIALGIASLGLTTLAVVARCPRLGPCGALLAVAGFFHVIMDSPNDRIPVLGLALLAIVTLLPAMRLPDVHRRVTALILRGTAFPGFCLFWWNHLPANFGDSVALMSLALMAAGYFLKRRQPLETWGFLLVGLLWFAFVSFSSPWTAIEDGASWRGAGVMFALLFLLAGNQSSRPAEQRRMIGGVASGIACTATAVWATQMLVWRHDWDATAVLWTLLGFIAVSAGLWQRLMVARQIGFALMALAVIKVFAVDVWDFNAFMRVVSFIVLGVALILLGLFYNKFASVMKRLIDEEKPV